MPLSPAQEIPTQRYSVEEYRHLEETTEGRREFHDGEIIDMTGGSVDHAQIILNLAFLLQLSLRGKGFRPFTSELRLWIPAHQRGTYPDVMVIAGEPILNALRRDEVLNPQLIVEVLSPATEAYDRGDKFLYYRSIPEFQEYLLVSSTRPAIDHYIRTASQQWLLQSYQSLDDCLPVATGNLQLPMAEIYENVAF